MLHENRLDIDGIKDNIIGMTNVIFEPRLDSTTLRSRASFASTHYRWNGKPFFHYHPDYELTLMTGSRGQRFVGDSVTRYAGPDLVFAGPNLPHTWIADTFSSKTVMMESSSVQFTKESLGLEMMAKEELKGVDDLLQRAVKGLHFTGTVVHEIEKQFMRLRGLSGLKQWIIFISMLDQLASCKEYEILASEQYKRTFSDYEEKIFSKVIKHIHGRPGEKINLHDIARLAGMSVSTFSRFFKKMTGATFVGYINEWRINRAGILLQETDDSITNIGLGAGFNNLAHFNRMFRRIYKVSPRQFRASRPAILK